MPCTTTCVPALPHGGESVAISGHDRPHTMGVPSPVDMSNPAAEWYLSELSRVRSLSPGVTSTGLGPVKSMPVFASVARRRRRGFWRAHVDLGCDVAAMRPPVRPEAKSAVKPASFGAAMLVSPTGTQASFAAGPKLESQNTSATPTFAETSGTSRHVGHVESAASGCHDGHIRGSTHRRRRTSPPLVPAHVMPTAFSQSFHTGSRPGEPSDVPPTPVTSGSSAGSSTCSDVSGDPAVGS